MLPIVMLWIQDVLEELFSTDKPMLRRRIRAGAEMVFKAGKGATIELYGQDHEPVDAGNNKEGIVCTWYDEATQSYQETIINEGTFVVRIRGKASG